MEKEYEFFVGQLVAVSPESRTSISDPINLFGVVLTDRRIQWLDGSVADLDEPRGYFIVPISEDDFPLLEEAIKAQKESIFEKSNVFIHTISDSLLDSIRIKDGDLLRDILGDTVGKISDIKALGQEGYYRLPTDSEILLLAKVGSLPL